MQTITIPEAEYRTLLEAKEDLDDIIAFDEAIAAGGDGLPHDFMLRLIGGESPLLVFRQWRELSQSALARRSGVNRVQIADIEAGRATGSVLTLKKLAEALEITIDDLV